MLVTDTFPAPALDATKWTLAATGLGVSALVGFPVDGLYPLSVDDHGDYLSVRTDGKVVVPAGKTFDARVFYRDVYSDPEQNIIPFFGWRSSAKDGMGNPLYVVEIQLLVSTTPTWKHRYRIVNGGAESFVMLGDDPLAGANSGFRIVRIGQNYSLFRWDGFAWVNLSTVLFGYIGDGFVEFGVMAVDPSLLVFPWVAQT